MKKIHRFITEYFISKDTLEITDKNIVHQIKNVLKLKVGEMCIVTNKDNIEYNCTILENNKNKILFKINSKKINTLEPKNKIDLYLSVLKKENFELVVQKASEMGVSKIIPIITERTIKINLNYERLERIAREASELSGRSMITHIDKIQNFQDAIKKDKNETKILFDISGEKFKNIKDKQSKKSIYIGPEGGFTEKEIESAIKEKTKIYSLGDLMLRGETAGIIASYITLND